MSFSVRNSERYSRRLSSAIEMEDEYFEQRNIVSPRPLNENHADVSDFYSRSLPSPGHGGAASRISAARSSSVQRVSSAHRASSAQRNTFVRTSVHAQNMQSDVDVAAQTRMRQEKSISQQNYEEFIQRLQAENVELKGSEQRLLQIAALKKNLEIELEQVSTQLAVYRRNGGEPAVERLKQLVQELTEQKAQLRRQLEQNKYEISQLVTNVTNVRSTNDNEMLALRGQLATLQSNYDRLMEEYRSERGRPIQIPDDPQLRRLLEEKMNEVESLKARVRFLDDQLRIKSGPCVACPAKDAAISELRGHVRELELREQRRSVQAVPRPDIIQNSVTIYPPRAETEKNNCAQTACTTSCCGCTCTTVCCTAAECSPPPGCGTVCGGACECFHSQSTVSTTNVTETVTTTAGGGQVRSAEVVTHPLHAVPVGPQGHQGSAAWQMTGAGRTMHASPTPLFRPSAPASVYADVPLSSPHRIAPSPSIAQELLERRRSATRSTMEAPPSPYRLTTAPAMRYTGPQIGRESAASSLRQNLGTVRTETYSLS